MQRLYARVASRARRPGPCVFSAMDCLSPAETTLAVATWQRLAASGLPVRLLNHPARALRRYELLRTRYERGINGFAASRLTEARWPARYPVCLREDRAHGG